jgi:integrase
LICVLCAIWPGVRRAGLPKAEPGTDAGPRRRRRRLDDLRHTAASLWLAAGADPKVVQRVLGHATAAMMMDLYGHLVDASL